MLRPASTGGRKPGPLIFRAAPVSASLSPEQVWFCGDRIEADVSVAQAASICPVWYENTTVPNSFAKKKNAGLTITGGRLHIHPWHELIRAIDLCPQGVLP